MCSWERATLKCDSYYKTMGYLMRSLPFWDTSKFLVPPHAEVLSTDQQTKLEEGCAKLNRMMELSVKDADFVKTQNEISQRQIEINGWFARHFPCLTTEQSSILTRVQSREFWSAAREKLRATKGLDQTERSFTRQYESNSNAGEMITGHWIVLAELGLVPYEGHIVRDEQIF